MPDVGKLQKILEAAGAGAGKFYLLQGRGRILAALPAEPEGFVRTLALYRPQRSFARLWVRFVSLLHGGRLQRLFLPLWSWPGAPSPSLPCPGVLLGNPDHPVPRAMLVTREKDSWVVGKFIPDPNQQNLLRREQDLLQAASRLGGHAPEVLGWKPCGQGGALWTRWLDPQPGNSSRRDRLKILHAWLLPKAPRSLSDFPAWKVAGHSSALPTQLASALRLRPSLRHGDFTPWNLLKNSAGCWVAVDWEDGCEEDAPGLDLVHDLLQEEFLIRRSSAREAWARMENSLRQPLVAAYLSACGWAGNETPLLHWAMAFESTTRPEIRRWVDAR